MPRAFAAREELLATFNQILSRPIIRCDPLRIELHHQLLRLVGAPALNEATTSSIRGTLSSEVAGRCVADWPRTYRFVHAITSAVDALLACRPRSDLYLVDAGCGPFAFLAVVAALRSERVRGVCIEGNKESAQLARRVITALGLDTQLSVVEADALTYRPERPIDLFVTETFDVGLRTEQGAGIMENFLRDLAPSGVAIPDGVRVEGSIRPRASFLRMSDKYWSTVHSLSIGSTDKDCRRGYGAGVIGRNLRPGNYELFLSTTLLFPFDVAVLNRFTPSPISTPALAARIYVPSGLKTLSLELCPGTPTLTLATDPACVPIECEGCID